MKKINNFILAAVALFAIQPAVNAQTPPYVEKNNIAYSKTVSGPVDGIYTIHLNTFVTGEKTVTEQSIPADIILVLDVSGSMSEDYISTYSYTARQSQSYTPNDINRYEYYYLYTDGNYYRVNYGGGQGNRNIYFTAGDNSTYYLVGTGIQGNPPSGYGGNNNIWSGVLYTRQTISSQTKIDALKAAVNGFIDVVRHNDLYDSKGELRDEPLGNQIAIVKFAADRYCNANGTQMSSPYTYDGEFSNIITAGNHRGAKNNNDYNYTEVLAGFTSTATESSTNGTEYLKGRIAAINEGGATAANFGLTKAKYLLESIKDSRTNSTKTVVMFTDGIPGTNGWDRTFANQAISVANELKNTYGATIYTVGVFNNLGDDETNVINYMNYVSSNYPNAQSMTDVGSPGENQDFYQDASDTDLSSIFRSIAAESGGSGATTVTAEATTTVDIVSQSFEMPEGATGDIHIYFANCNGKDANGYLTFDTANKMGNPEEGVEGHVSLVIDEDTQKITATGFDYSGNWCGYDESIKDYHGMMLMIEIPIEMAPDAVGGSGVGTNGAGSGIYVDGKPVMEFETPHINLPTNLHIKKEGMADGECATFEIYRRALKKQTDGTYVIDESVAWETTPYKTVLVISGQRDNTVKLMGLDPTYQYKIVEAGWSWSYTLDHVKDFEGNTLEGDITSDRLITNPFIFVNSKNATQVRHAESAVYNDFSKSGEVKGNDVVGENKKASETENK